MKIATFRMYIQLQLYWHSSTFLLKMITYATVSCKYYTSQSNEKSPTLSYQSLAFL